MMNNAYVLTKFDPLSAVIDECPRAGELLAEYGLHCVSCFANEFDTIETGAQMHGMTDEEVDEMIDEINEQLDKEWRKEQKKGLGTSA
jgi:hybrid cluster-associated redox disulfide protein